MDPHTDRHWEYKEQDWVIEISTEVVPEVLKETGYLCC